MDLALLMLRLGAGIMFAAHGAQKMFGAFGGPGIKGFSAVLSGLGFVPAQFWAYIGAGTELFGGIFLIAGLFTRASCLFLIIFMIVATVRVHLPKGFFLANGGFEYNFVILSVLLALLLAGPGKFGIMKGL